MRSMIFSDLSEILRIVLIGLAAYVYLIVLLRLTGKRTLSKLNAFDFVITVALGSTVATILLSADVSLAEGMAALALLVLAQFALTWVSVRSPFFRMLIRARPVLLFYEGEFLEEQMKSSRISRGEVLEALRDQGAGRLDEVGAVVLETTGTLSVIKRSPGGGYDTLRGVEGADEVTGS